MLQRWKRSSSTSSLVLPETCSLLNAEWNVSCVMPVTSLNRFLHVACLLLQSHTLGHSSCEFTCTAVMITNMICTIILVKLWYFTPVLKQVYVCLISLLVNRLLDITSSDNTVWDLKLISVPQRCACAFVYLPKFRPVLSQYLEQVVFICYSAAGSESLNVQCVTFAWQSCGSNECRLIFGMVWYGIITELLFRRMIQTMKHKYRFHDHFSTFLVTAINEFETKTATRSARQFTRQSAFLGTWVPL